MKTLKHSRQRDAIKNYLLSSNDHPSADIVYDYVKKEFPNISLATVYRNLNLLVELKEAIKIRTKDGSDRFDAKIDSHYHFICVNCNAVKDIMIDPIISIENDISNLIDGVITNHEINFFGLCNNCKDQQK